MPTSYAKLDSPVELALQKIESILSEHGLTLSCNGYLHLNSADHRFLIVDVDNGGLPSSQLPRNFESERLKVLQ